MTFLEIFCSAAPISERPVYGFTEGVQNKGSSEERGETTFPLPARACEFASLFVFPLVYAPLLFSYNYFFVSYPFLF